MTRKEKEVLKELRNDLLYLVFTLEQGISGTDDDDEKCYNTKRLVKNLLRVCEERFEEAARLANPWEDDEEEDPGN